MDNKIMSMSSFEVVNKSKMEGEKDVKQRFMEVYQQLKKEILEDPLFAQDHVCRQRLEYMLDYTIPQGKRQAGMFIIESFKLLNGRKPLSEDEYFRACVYGCYFHWELASILIIDDIVDNSHTRNNKHCWFRLPEVGIIAANDAFLLTTQAKTILRKHLKDQPYYADLVDINNEMIYKMACGEMIELTTSLDSEGEKFTPALCRRIAQLKTSRLLVGLVASVLLMTGKKLDKLTDEVKDILFEMGIIAQAQNDYADCFGHPEKIGKIGSDIEESKCTWFIVKALELCNKEQKILLCENYTKGDPASVEIVKSLYKELNLQAIFEEHKVNVQKKLISRIEALPDKDVKAVLKSIVKLCRIDQDY